MDEEQNAHSEQTVLPVDIRTVIKDAIKEFISIEQTKAEPAYKAELVEERKRREQLESRVNDLVQENRRTRAVAEESERNSTIRTELQRLGVSKIDLAFKAVKDDVYWTPEGRLSARTEEGDLGVREYLTRFVSENPELLPARIPGGSGTTTPHRAPHASGVDLDGIKPGMSTEDLDRVRREIARVASQSGL